MPNPTQPMNEEELRKEVKRSHEHVSSLESEIERSDDFNAVKALQHRLDIASAYASGLQRAEHYFALAEADRNAAIREARDATHNLYKKEIAMYKQFQDMHMRNEQLKIDKPLLICAGCAKKLDSQSQPNAKEDSNE